jgi:hypothetical protein
MKLVDPKVYELAEYFLPQQKVCHKETLQEFAEYIQQAVEDFLSGCDEEGDEEGCAREDHDTLANLGLSEDDFR